MAELDYEALLKRARESLPERIITRERFRVPGVEVFIEGKTTVFRNFEEIANAINREPSQILVYLLRELGTAGIIDGKRVVFKGRVPGIQIEKRLKGYIETFVLCSECQRPDTKLVKEGRVTLLECDACGAHRPVKFGRILPREEEAPLVEGKVYEVMIQDIGKKGDGIAKKDKYIIYVPGTAKGSIVKIRIDKITGNIAFATLSRE
ncbi:MAG: translation initiation factor IF-2 subunit beta [Thermoplasmata archaeon]|jgi:translation initiation factor 2 subunit 2|nr:translation initiation factor IF-2 subunit beta [Candidatus Thermoplasmatota archaeon]MCJ2669175.1 translation initiation factor IF-2 subunit beta [Candidatus Thermoplasmatota archaeon]MCK4948794.1 translation initiation factor IF-2 subunit beta [Thermoplasmata archaeon]